METLYFIAKIWIYLSIIAIILISFTKNGTQHLREYGYLLLTCNIFSGIMVLFIAYAYLPFTIIESLIKIIKENPIR